MESKADAKAEGRVGKDDKDPKHCNNGYCGEETVVSMWEKDNPGKIFKHANARMITVKKDPKTGENKIFDPCNGELINGKRVDFGCDTVLKVGNVEKVKDVGKGDYYLGNDYEHTPVSFGRENVEKQKQVQGKSLKEKKEKEEADIKAQKAREEARNKKAEMDAERRRLKAEEKAKAEVKAKAAANQPAADSDSGDDMGFGMFDR